MFIFNDPKPYTMKKLKSFLKWSLIISLGLIIIFIGSVYSLQHKKYKAQLPPIVAVNDSTVIERGRYLVYGPAHCVDCHGDPKRRTEIEAGKVVPLSGGMIFHLPIGNIHVPNITSDATGVLNYSDAQIARSLRYGVGFNDEALFDIMPFHNTSDADLTAIISYIRTLPPTVNKVPAKELNFMGKIVTAFMLKPVGPDHELIKSIKADSTKEYGEYLARSVANCRGCHTNRDLKTGAFIGKDYAGGLVLPSEVIRGQQFMTPNLTPDKETGRIANWDEATFVQRFHNGKLLPGSPMPWGPYRTMSDMEIKAIYRYIVTVPAVNNETTAGPIVAEK